MDRFLGPTGFTPKGTIDPTTPTVMLPIGTCWVCWSRLQSIELRLHGVHLTMVIEEQQRNQLQSTLLLN